MNCVKFKVEDLTSNLPPLFNGAVEVFVGVGVGAGTEVVTVLVWGVSLAVVVDDVPEILLAAATTFPTLWQGVGLRPSAVPLRELYSWGSFIWKFPCQHHSSKLLALVRRTPKFKLCSLEFGSFFN
jgi:hypothetical protein